MSISTPNNYASWQTAYRKRAQVLHHRSAVASTLARYQLATSDLDQAVAIAEACDDEGLALRCRGDLVTIDYLTGRLDQGLEQAEFILRHEAVSGYPEVLAKVHSDIGNIHIRRCRFRDAERAFRSSIDIADRPELLQHRAVALYNLANGDIIEGSFRKALDLYGQALQIFEQLGDVPKAAQVQKSISQTYLRLEDVTAARAAIEQALAMQRRVCNYRAIASCTLDLANILESEGRPDEAAEQVHVAAGVATRHGITDPYLWAVIYGTDAYMAVEQRNLRRAEDILNRLIPLAEVNAFTNHLIRARCLLGLVHVLHGQAGQGLTMIEQGIEQARAGGLMLEQLDGWERKTQAYRDLGDVLRQIDCLQRCIEVSEAMGSRDEKYRTEIARLQATGTGRRD